LISYDISDPRRLARIARFLEKYAMRVQYSVYLYVCDSMDEKEGLTQKLLSLMDKEEDDIRIYQITSGSIALGCAVDLDDPMIFL
jgi:CRISPR-associated protein Cas2